MDNKERAITYSLLAHIRNTGTLAKGPIDIFIPLVKRALSKMNAEGVYSGKSLLEIKARTDQLYKIDFPIPILKKILLEICNEVNDENDIHLILYKDGAFSIKQYSFTEFDEVVEDRSEKIDELEYLFEEFCKTSEFNSVESESIFKFIEKNKFTLSKYLSNNAASNSQDYTVEAQFVDFFKKIPLVYDQIKSIYIGSIIAGYIEYESHEASQDIELLLDTNFVVGLIDLNTPESTHTCRTLLKIALLQKFKVRVLKDTIEETINLLGAKADNFDKSFLQKKVNPEDVYNACERRKLNRSDLERITDNLERTIDKFGISIIYNTDKLKKEARFTEAYEWLKNVRRTKRSALHDAMAFLHINKIRKKKFRDFQKVNAWFVNNSITGENDSIFMQNGIQPETIKADDLLNILWLSNPQVNATIEGSDLAEIGLTSAISLTLNKNLPKSQILKELDDNIHKYAKEQISDTDVIRVATRITNKQLKNIEELNALAEKDKVEFVRRLEEEASKQKRIEKNRLQKLEDIFEKMSVKAKELEEVKGEFDRKAKLLDSFMHQSDNNESKLKNKLLTEQNRNRKIFREQWYSEQLSKWRMRTWIEFILMLVLLTCVLLLLLYQCDWNVSELTTKFENKKIGLISAGTLSLLFFVLTSITVKTLFNKYRNHSNITSYRNSLEVPENLKELNEPI